MRFRIIVTGKGNLIFIGFKSWVLIVITLFLVFC
jgi:hypothetical protein